MRAMLRALNESCSSKFVMYAIAPDIASRPKAMRYLGWTTPTSLPTTGISAMMSSPPGMRINPAFVAS